MLNSSLGRLQIAVAGHIHENTNCPVLQFITFSQDLQHYKAFQRLVQLFSSKLRPGLENKKHF